MKCNAINWMDAEDPEISPPSCNMLTCTKGDFAEALQKVHHWSEKKIDSGYHGFWKQGGNIFLSFVSLRDFY